MILVAFFKYEDIQVSLYSLRKTGQKSKDSLVLTHKINIEPIIPKLKPSKRLTKLQAWRRFHSMLKAINNSEIKIEMK